MNRQQEQVSPVAPFSMLLTSSEAKAKVCPLLRSTCVVEVCMFWKFAMLATSMGKKGRCTLVLNDIETKRSTQ